MASNAITFANVTLESDKYVCVRETSPTSQLLIVDLSNPSAPQRRPITAESAIMNPAEQIIALKAKVEGVNGDNLQVFNLATKQKLKAIQFGESIVFWKWFSDASLGMVTARSVYHWNINSEANPVKVFDRAANLENTQIISYRVDPTEKWCVLVGIAPGAPERPQLVKGFMQLYSVEQGRSQSLDAHAAVFGTVGTRPVIAFAQKKLVDGAPVSKLHVIELGAPGQTTIKKNADLLFPPEFADDFPVAMQVGGKYGLVYVVTKLGLLFVYDLETAAPVYRTRMS